MLVASATLVIGIVGPKVPLHTTCSYSMLVFACYIGHWHYWDMRARGTFIWGPMLPSALERCSLRAWHMVFACGVARALCAWSGAPSALAARNGLYCMSCLNIGPGRY